MPSNMINFGQNKDIYIRRPLDGHQYLSNSDNSTNEYLFIKFINWILFYKIFGKIKQLQLTPGFWGIH